MTKLAPPNPIALARTKQLLTWLAIGLIFFLFIYAIRSVLLPFLVGMFAAYFLDPAADKLERAGLGRTTATGIIIGLFFTVITLAAILIVPALVHQAVELIEAIPGYLQDLQQHYGARFERWLSYLTPQRPGALQDAAGNVAGSLLNVTGNVLTGVLMSGMALMNVLSLLLIMPLVAFYLLRDWDNITHRIDRLLPLPYAPAIREQLLRINATLAGFIRGQINVCLILAVYYALLLSIIGLKFGLVIGLATGLLVILPYVGFLFCFLIALGVGFVQFGFAAEFWMMLGVYALGQAIESYFLTPKLVGESVGLHPLWIIFGMLAGAALFGFVGILLAVPATAVIGVLIRFAIERYLTSPLYYGA